MPTTPDVRRPRTTTRRQVPDPHELAALTGDRDRVIDLLRIGSLLVVVAGHSIMLTVDRADGSIGLGNTLADVPVLQPATWLLQVLPLFFFAGAAAATRGWMSPGRAHPTAGQWLFTRAQRLLRPLVWYLGVVVLVLVGLTAADFDAAADVVARLGVQLLWFLGAYLLVLAVVPALQRMSSPRHVGLALIGCWGATAVVDAVRLSGGPPAAGYLNFVVVWTIPAILGVAYARRLVRPVVALVLSGGMLLVDLALVHVGPYEVSLVTVPGQQLSNMSPPSLLLAGHAIVLCAAAIGLRSVLARIADRPRIWWLTVLGNRGAMTLYLWHLPVLAAIIGLGEALGVHRADVHAGSFGFVVAAQTLALLALMVPVTGVLSRWENRPLRWWDDPVARRAAPPRDHALLVTLAVLGGALLMVARGGLVDAGPVWATAAVVAAVLARCLAVRAEPVTGHDAVSGRHASLQVSASPRSTTLDGSHRRPRFAENRTDRGAPTTPSIHRRTHEEHADRGHFRRRNGIPRTRRPRGSRLVGDRGLRRGVGSRTARRGQVGASG